MRHLLPIFLLLAGLLLPTSVFAASEFSTRYQTTYRLDNSSVAHVQMNISLRNKFSNFYASRFSLSLGLTNLQNIKVWDGQVLLSPKIETTQNQTTISFEFANKIVGKDKIHDFVIAFDTIDIASKNGAVWEVNIPPLEASSDLESQTVTLEVPLSWGQPATISPTPNQHQTSGTLQSFLFEKNNLGNQPISAVFGSTQYINFTINYFLSNESPQEQLQEIALIPDTNYQQVYYQKLDPQPRTVLLDTDGNWLAQFLLQPRQELKITTQGVVKLSLTPQTSPLTPQQTSQYLQPSLLWQTDHPQIKTLAQQLKNPQAIFEYVTDKLSYDYTKLTTGPQRLGALGALLNPFSAICTEFTDLFVALTRSINVPARELEGFAFTSNDRLRPVSLNKDVLHAWPEYYDFNRQTWIQVDPTWTVTTGGVDYFHKFDLNHIVFAIHGTDPLQPLPAGAYNDSTSQQKNVLVEPTEPIIFPPAQTQLSLKSIRDNTLTLTLSNTGSTAVNDSLVITSQPTGIINYQTEIRNLPPFGFQDLRIPLAATSGLGRIQSILLVKFLNSHEETSLPFSYSSKPLSSLLLAASLGILFVACAATYLTRRLYLRRKAAKTPLYW